MGGREGEWQAHREGCTLELGLFGLDFAAIFALGLRGDAITCLFESK